MNALPMNLMVAPTSMVAPAPAPGAPARDGSEPGFAQCLEQAVEREPQATDTPPGTADEAAPADAADAAEAPTIPRGTRRAPGTAAHPRKAEPGPNAAAALAASPEATTATAAKPAAVTDGGPDELATASKKNAPPELAELLPGWAPASPLPPVVPTATAVASAEPPHASDAAVAATVLPSRAALPGEASAAAKLPRPEESTVLPAFALPASAPASAPSAAPSHDTPVIVQAHVPAPVDSPAFAPALATQVRWLVRDGLQHAQLSLNPAEMGPVTVQIVLDGREARIDFRADLALTRNAIEASLPVLAAALDDSGLRLAGGGVHDGQASRHGQGAGQQGWNGATHGASTAFGDTGGGPDAAVPATTRVAAPTRGLVDLVA